jgi:hypothetical protein
MGNDTPELTTEQLATMSDEEFDKYTQNLWDGFIYWADQEERATAQQRYKEDKAWRKKYADRQTTLAIHIRSLTEHRQDALADRKAARNE